MKNVETITYNKKKSLEYIRHEYPKNRKYHPFDITSIHNTFIYADGFTYLMNIDESLDTKNILQVIPKSYRPYSVLERYMIISNGEIIWENKELTNLDNYLILSLKKELISKNKYTHHRESVWDIQDDIDTYKNISKNNNNIYMIAKIK